MKIRLSAYTSALALIFIFSINIIAQPNDPSTFIINYAETSGEADTQQLRAYFTVLDEGNTPVANPQIDSVVFDIGGDEVTTRAAQPPEPLLITLVIDTSGSIGRVPGLVEEVREAARQAIVLAPPNTQFAIYSFNEDITLETGFTDSGSALRAIDNIRFSNAGTCLYDATFQAVQLMTNTPGIPGRKAILLFTDGRDELTGGQGDTCSTVATFTDVLAAAIRQVSIYAIALQGSNGPNEAELKRLTDATGGLTLAGSRDQLGSFFSLIIGALTAQHVAIAPTCVNAGTYDVTITLNLDNDQLQKTLGGVEFLGTCVPPTPVPTLEPVTIVLEPARFNVTNNSVDFRMAVTGGDQIASIRVEVMDENAGAYINEGRANQTLAGTTREFSIPISDVVDPRFPEVVFRVAALDASGNVIGEMFQTEAIPIAVTPTPTPIIATATPAPSVDIISLAYDADSREFIVEANFQQVNQIEQYTVQIIGPDGQQVERFTRIDAPSNEIRISEAEITGQNYLPGGDYTIRVWINGDSFNASPGAEARFTKPQPPTPEPTAVPTATPEPQILDLNASFSNEQRSFIINVDVGGEPNITNYQVRIEDSAGNEVANRQESTFPSSGQVTIAENSTSVFSERRLSDGSLPPGEYTVTLILAVNGVPLPPVEDTLTVDPPPQAPQPGFFERITQTFRENILFAILLMIFVIIVFVLGSRYLRRTSDNTPEYAPVYGQSDGGTPGKGDFNQTIGISTSGSKGQSAATLELIQSPEIDPVTISLTRDQQYHIGRKEGNAITVKTNAVTNEHATIYYDNGSYYIVDNNSRNHTFVNGAQITPARPYRLDRGGPVEIRLAHNTVLRFQYVDDRLPRAVSEAKVADHADDTRVPDGSASKLISAHITIAASDKDEVDKQFPVTEDGVTIGRLANNNIVMGGEGISGNHAQITWDGSQFRITDLKSTNGTFLKTRRLKANEETVLEADTEHRIGLGTKNVITFVYSVRTQPPADTPKAFPGGASDLNKTMIEGISTAPQHTINELMSNLPSMADVIVDLTVEQATGYEAGQRLDLVNGIIRIGRAPDINDFVVQSNAISGTHAEIYQEAEALFIADLKSTNGTFVNEEKLTPQRPFKLHPEVEYVIRMGVGTQTPPVILKLYYRVFGGVAADESEPEQGDENVSSGEDTSGDDPYPDMDMTIYPGSKPR